MNEQIVNQDFEIVKELGELPLDSVVTEDGLAKLFSRHPISIKRAIERKELPPAIKLFGKPCWTVRIIQEYLAKRLERAQHEAEQMERKINQLSA